MAQLFDRQVELTVYDDTGKGRVWDGNRIAFRVDHTKRSKPNTATIEAYGLSPPSRKWIKEYGETVRLVAGHGTMMGGVFLGDVSRSSVMYRPSEVVTKIECGDGENAYTEGRVNITLAPGSTIRDAINESVSALGLELGFLSPLEALSTPFLNGITMNGRAAAVLDNLTEQIGAHWSIQDNVIQIVSYDDVLPEAAAVIEVETGLIASPQLLVRKTEQRVRTVGVKFAVLLNPGMRPGRAIELRTREFNGFYRCERAKMVGDSGFNKPFYTMVEAKEL